MAETLVDQAERERADRDRDERDKALRAQKEAEQRTEEYMQTDEFTVVAPYVTLKMNDGLGGLVVRGFLEGANINADDVDEANLRHHVETGLMAPKDSPEARFAAPAGTPKPGEPPNVPVEERPAGSLPLDERLKRQREAAEQAEERQSARESGGGRPKQTDDKATWLEYRISQRVQQRPEGQSEEEARAQAQAELEGKSKADLVAGK